MAAYEALRIAARQPRFGLDTDHRTIPHEVGWIESAVHLNKGCYRGQETVARVHNLGHPPRRLVFLHLDGSEDRLPGHGDPVQLEGAAIGFCRIGRAALRARADRARADQADHPGGRDPAGSRRAAAQEVVVPPDAGANVTVTLSAGPGWSASGLPPGPCWFLSKYWRSSTVLRRTLLAASGSDRVRRLITSAPLTRGVVARYVAGDGTADAVRASRELLHRGLLVSLDYLGEDTVDPEQAAAVTAEYIALLSQLAAAGAGRRRPGGGLGQAHRGRPGPARARGEDRGRQHRPDLCRRPGGRDHGHRGHGRPHPGGPDAADRRGDPAGPPGPGRGHPVLAAPLGGGLRRARAGRRAGSGSARERTTPRVRWPTPRATTRTAVTPARCAC